MSGLTIRTADLTDVRDCQLLAMLTDAYARDAMGGGDGLSPARQQALADALPRHPGLFALIAEMDGEAVGHALCVLGFSSFYAAPICNLHDLSVMKHARGLGLGRQLLQSVEAAARERGCAKMTLEVREDNQVGYKLYTTAGFKQAGLGDAIYLLLEKRFGSPTT